MAQCNWYQYAHTACILQVVYPRAEPMPIDLIAGYHLAEVDNRPACLPLDGWSSHTLIKNACMLDANIHGDDTNRGWTWKFIERPVNSQSLGGTRRLDYRDCFCSQASLEWRKWRKAWWSFSRYFLGSGGPILILASSHTGMAISRSHSPRMVKSICLIRRSVECGWIRKSRRRSKGFSAAVSVERSTQS